MSFIDWFFGLFNIEIDRHKCKFKKVKTLHIIKTDLYECPICKNTRIISSEVKK